MESNNSDNYAPFWPFILVLISVFLYSMFVISCFFQDCGFGAFLPNILLIGLIILSTIIAIIIYSKQIFKKISPEKNKLLLSFSIIFPTSPFLYSFVGLRLSMYFGKFLYFFTSSYEFMHKISFVVFTGTVFLLLLLFVFYGVIYWKKQKSIIKILTIVTLLLFFIAILDVTTQGIRFDCSGYEEADCLINRAVDKNDVNECEYFVWALQSDSFLYDCVGGFAKQKELTFEECENLKWGSLKDECLLQSSYSSLDESLCSYIDSKPEQNLCYQSITEIKQKFPLLKTCKK